MTSQIDLSGAIDNPCAEQREQSRAYQDHHEPYREHVRLSRSPRALPSAETGERKCSSFLFSRVRKNPEVLAHSERPALSSVCAGRFVSKVA